MRKEGKRGALSGSVITFSGTRLGESIVLSGVCARMDSWAGKCTDLGKEPLDRLTDSCDCPGFPSLLQPQERTRRWCHSDYSCPPHLGCCPGPQAHFVCLSPAVLFALLSCSSGLSCMPAFAFSHGLPPHTPQSSLFLPFPSSPPNFNTML